MNKKCQIWFFYFIKFNVIGRTTLSREFKLKFSSYFNENFVLIIQLLTLCFSTSLNFFFFYCNLL